MSPRTAREIDPEIRTRMEGQVARERQENVRPGRPVQSEGDQRAVERIRANHVLVRRRRHLVAGRAAWDVYRIEGDRLILVVAGCHWREEALALASDALLGRLSISMAGVRTVFGGARDNARTGRDSPLAAPKGADLVRLGDRPIQIQTVTAERGPLLPGDLIVTGKDSARAKQALAASRTSEKGRP